MIRCMMIKFTYIFKDRGEVEEILPKFQLPKNVYGYIGSALVDSVITMYVWSLVAISG